MFPKTHDLLLKRCTRANLCRNSKIAAKHLTEEGGNAKKYTGPERRKIKRSPRRVYFQALIWEQKNRKEVRK